MDRHLPVMIRLARRLLRDDSEAEDVAQEAFLKLWHIGATLEIGPAGVGPWLKRVFSNLAIDRIRARSRLDVTDDVPDIAESASQQRQLEQKDLKARVDEALARLPERQRIALTMFQYVSLSMDEIGRVMGVSGEAMESLLARARRSLRDLLAADWKALLPDSGDDV